TASNINGDLSTRETLLCRTTPFSSGTGCKNFIPRKAVMPARSSARAGYSSWLDGGDHKEVRRGPRSRVFPLQDQQHPVGSGLGLELKWPIGNAAGEIEAQFQLVSLPFVNPFKEGAFQGARFNLQINALRSWGSIDFDSELAGLFRQRLDALEGKLITLDDAFEMLHDIL